MVHSSALPALLALLFPISIAAPRSRLNLRVMTYNIHVGIGMDKKLDLQRIADVINPGASGSVGLQESSRRQHRGR
jgi:endonuclease/exonuclease/phosphatase family metal-dependent hydrolase